MVRHGIFGFRAISASAGAPAQPSKLSTTSPQTKAAEERPIVSQACHFCKSRHLKCDGNNPCIQCELRRQECVFSAAPKKRGRKGKGAEESAAKKPKLPSDTHSSSSKIPNGHAHHKGPRLLSNQQQTTLQQIERGDPLAYRVEDIIDLILAQQAKLHQKKEVLEELDYSGLLDLSDFEQDREYIKVGGTDIDFEPDYPDEKTFGEALYRGFSQRYGMYYPSGVVTVDVEHVQEYLTRFNKASEVRRMLSGTIYELTEAYCYGVFLTSAASVLLRWRLGIEYAERTALLARNMIRGQIGRYDGCVSKALACTGFLVLFHMGVGNYAQARNGILLRYNFFNCLRSSPTGSSSAMIFACMAGTTVSPEGRLHWTLCSEGLAPSMRSPLTEVLRTVISIGEIFARDEPLLDWTALTSPCPSDNEMVLRNKLWEDFDTIEASIGASTSYIYARHAETQAVLRQMLHGSKALTAFLLGKHEEALNSAILSIHNSPQVDRHILGPWQMFALGFSIQVSIALMHRDLYRMGMEAMRFLGTGHPAASKFLDRLTDQYSHAEAEMARFQLIGSALPLQPLQHPGLLYPGSATGISASLNGGLTGGLNASGLSAGLNTAGLNMGGALRSWAPLDSTPRHNAFEFTTNDNRNGIPTGFVMSSRLAEELQLQQQMATSPAATLSQRPLNLV